MPDQTKALLPVTQDRLIYVRWSDDGQHISKWAREPFEGATAFANAGNGAPLGPFDADDHYPLKDLPFALRSIAENIHVECADHVLEDMVRIVTDAASLLEASQSHSLPGDVGMLVDQAWLDRRQAEPDASVEAGYFSHPHIAEPARRIIERVADAVTTMQREGTAAMHEMAETIAKECIPHFEKLGMSNEGEGWGFDEDLFGHDDFDRLFRLRWDADQRATKRWQAGDELAHCGELRPLLGEVLDFLREANYGAAPALVERLSAELEETKPGNRDAIWPDHADMVVWLLGELDHLAALTPSPCPGDGMREALANELDAFVLVRTNDPALAIEVGNKVRAALPSHPGDVGKALEIAKSEIRQLGCDPDDIERALARINRAALTPSALSDLQRLGQEYDGASALSGDAGEPVAYLLEHAETGDVELELFRHGAAALTDADRAAGWTETELYARRR